MFWEIVFIVIFAIVGIVAFVGCIWLLGKGLAVFIESLDIKDDDEEKEKAD